MSPVLTEAACAASGPGGFFMAKARGGVRRFMAVCADGAVPVVAG